VPRNPKFHLRNKTMLKISIEPTEREKSLRDIYGDPKEEWKQIEREFLLLQFRMKQEELIFKANKNDSD